MRHLLILICLCLAMHVSAQDDTKSWFADYIEDVLAFLAEEGGLNIHHFDEKPF